MEDNNFLNNDTRCGLVWDKTGTEEEFEKDLKTYCPLLDEVESLDMFKDIENYNMIIEGDNYHSLSVMQYTHLNKFDVIITDPPYNTGKNFKYKDKWSVNSKGWVGDKDNKKHSKWLSFMEKRLKLAQKLLKKDGVLFINIDENERANLELLCKRIFPIFVGEIIWDKNKHKGDSQKISTCHEHILVFANEEFNRLGTIEKPNSSRMLKELDSLLKLKGKKKIPEDLRKRLKEVCGFTKISDVDKKFKDSISIVYTEEVIQREFKLWLNKQDFQGGEKAYKYIDFDKNDLYSSSPLDNPHDGEYKYDIIHPVTHLPCPKPQKGWRMPYKTFLSLDEKGYILYGKDHTIMPRRKYYLSENMSEPIKSIIRIEGANGVDDLKKLGMKDYFDYPKPVGLIEHLLKACRKDALILDFFAGSGTTGHAVLRLNKSDGGNRRFVLCTNNEVDEDTEKKLTKKFKKDELSLKIALEENGVCRKVCIPRIKKVMYEYAKENTKKCEIKSNLKVYRCTFVKKEIDNESLKYSLKNKLTELICIRHNAFNKVSDVDLMFRNDKEIIAITYSQNIDTIISTIDNLVLYNIENKLLYLFTTEEETLRVYESKCKENNIQIVPIPLEYLKYII